MLLAATPKLSEGGSLLTSQPTAECGDLAAIQAEMVIEQERIGKTALVEGAVNLQSDDSLAIALRYVDDIESDIETRI